MAPQRLEKIESAPGNGMASEASDPQHLVRRPTVRGSGSRASRMTRSRFGKLQKKAPNALKSLDAKLKSAPALAIFFAPDEGGRPSGRAGVGWT
jgi:hypothetical protein